MILTSLESQQRLEADLDIGEQSLDVGAEGKDDVDIDTDEGLDVQDKLVEVDSGIEEDLQVHLEVDENLDEGLDINVGLGNDIGCCLLVNARDINLRDHPPMSFRSALTSA